MQFLYENIFVEKSEVYMKKNCYAEEKWKIVFLCVKSSTALSYSNLIGFQGRDEITCFLVKTKGYFVKQGKF